MAMTLLEKILAEHSVKKTAVILSECAARIFSSKVIDMV